MERVLNSFVFADVMSIHVWCNSKKNKSDRNKPVRFVRLIWLDWICFLFSVRFSALAFWHLYAGGKKREKKKTYCRKFNPGLGSGAMCRTRHTLSLKVSPCCNLNQALCHFLSAEVAVLLLQSKVLPKKVTTRHLWTNISCLGKWHKMLTAEFNYDAWELSVRLTWDQVDGLGFGQ